MVEAYYDALDFKEFEKAYSLINPKNNLPIAQYMLEISVTDGLLSSYAKLDAIDTEITKHNDSVVSAKVTTNWITPLEKIEKVEYKSLSRHNGKWYLQPDDLNNDSKFIIVDFITNFFNLYLPMFMYQLFFYHFVRKSTYFK